MTVQTISKTALGFSDEFADSFMKFLAESDSPQCQSKHSDPLFPCSGEVTNLNIDCTTQITVCSSAAEALLWHRDQYTTCIKCERDARKCWTTRLI